MDVIKVLGHIESYAVENLARCVVDKLEFDMLEVFAYKFTGAKVFDAVGAENRFLIAGAKWVEQPEH